MNWVTKARQWLAKSIVRDIDHGGWIDVASAWNYWQSGQYSSNGVNNVVYACVQAYAQTIAQLPAEHLRKDAEGYKKELMDSAVARVMRRPNHYQTRSDFLLNLVHSLLFDGNAYALAERRGGAIVALHLVSPGACNPHVADGEIFYHVSPGDPSGLPPMLVPARDVLHVRMHTPHDPLRGESPIYAAALAIKVNTNAMGHTSKFFEQMSRPSGILTTPEKLTAEQTQALRQRWEEMSAGVNSGKVPILGWGFDWKPLSLSATDAQLIEALKFSVEDIARAYRTPLPLIGVLDQSSYNNVHNLLGFWKASGLGFVIEHIEQALAVLFDLPANERVELDTDNLLRTDLVSRIDAVTRGITGGLYSPNEARKSEGLPKVEGGDMPRVQQQMVPLDYEEPKQLPTPAHDPEYGDEQMRAIIESAAA